uniref:Cytochrome c oxidase assembly protein CtaG n=2 Tax=Oryzinae TaxID=1648021 RepID=A0A0D9VY97_9ORYZ
MCIGRLGSWQTSHRIPALQAAVARSQRRTPHSESRRRHQTHIAAFPAAPPPSMARLHRGLSLSILRGGHPPRHPWPPAADAFFRRGLASSSSSSSAAAAAAEREKSSRRTMAYLVGVAAAMVGASYAAVPLYRRFCQVTGYGGTTQRRESVEEKISRHARDGTTTSREIIVQFNADVADGMPWKFIPTQREVKVKPGESALAFYTAENRSSAPITGVSTYNVAPMKAAIYFNKIQCFCFEEQTLLPGEQIDMPVFFYIDPEFETDPKMEGVNNIVLSYTFFKVNDS